MSMFICHECGAYADSDEGCGESEDGKHCVCLDCVCERCGNPVSTDDVGYDLENNWCEECTDQAAYESAIQYMPYRFVNARFGK